MNIISRLLLLVSICLFTIPSFSQVNIGDRVPKFKALDENGGKWKLKKHLGDRYLVLYFYPAAMTGGCTKQACNYRDYQDEFEALGAKVFGISGDERRNLKIFSEEYNLSFGLLSDPDGKIARAFGVPTKEGGTIKREVHDKEVSLSRKVTASRWTFIIDKKGRVIYIDDKVEATKDTENTLELIRKHLAEGT